MSITKFNSLARTHRSRGTVLLMVIGVLALMAIIAVVYAALGRAERSAANAFVRAERNDVNMRDIGELLAQTVAEGNFAKYPELVPKRDQQAITSSANDFEVQWRIKAFDYPGIDDKALSVLPNAGQFGRGEYRFDASGSFVPLPQNRVSSGAIWPWPYWAPLTAAPPGADTNRPREHLTPFLSSGPTFIEQPDWVTSGERNGNWTLAVRRQGPNSSFAIAGRTSIPPIATRLIADWRALSNLAPSGNAVNLFNLRNNFDAQSGFGRDNTPDRRPRMSAQLTLFDPTDQNRQRVLVADADADPHQALPNMYRWDGLPARLNRPADWFTNQINAFRPLVDVTYPPSDPAYLMYSWADADGDGFVDARWIELVKIDTDPNNAQEYLTQSLLASLTNTRGGSDMRYFVATRIIDNSSLVNVNVATDNFLAPTSANPPGLTPADVDLQRVLTNYDTGHFWSRFDPTLGNIMENAPYGDTVIPQPAAGQPGDYRNVATGITRNDNRAYELGLASYASLRAAAAGAGVGLATDTRFSLGNQPVGATPTLYSPPLTPFDRALFYSTIAGEQGQTRSRDLIGNRVYEQRFTLRAGQLAFTLADEFELRAFNGLNDDSTLSGLESVLAGKHPSAPGFSPLRDSRPQSLERKYRDLPMPPVNGATFDPSQDQALFQFLTDIRQRITAVSGSRPIIDTPADELESRGLKIKLDATPLLLSLQSGEYVYDQPLGTRATLNDMTAARAARYDAIRRLFTAYYDALAPFADRSGAWNEPLPAAGLPRHNLAYGGSTELAIRTSAHVAVNAVDSYDIDRPLPLADDDRVRADRTMPTGTPSQLDQRRKEKQITDDDAIPTAVTLAISHAAAREMNTANNPYRRTDSGDADVDDIYPWPGVFAVQQGSGGIALLDESRHAATANAGNPRGAQGVALKDQYLGGLQTSYGLRVSQPNGTSQAGDTVERMNVYGIEAQPFLTDVAVYSISSDAPTGAGGDQDGEDFSNANTGAPPFVTIYRERDLGNADFIGDILTFTLHNPFDQRVYLYRASVGNPNNHVSKPRFYLEYANRYYSFANASETANIPAGGAIGIDLNRDVVIEAGETKVFYVINPGRLSDLAQRISYARESNGTTYTVTNLRDWLRHSFGNNIEPNPMVMVDPRTFVPVEQPIQNIGSVETPRVDVGVGTTQGGSGGRSEQLVPQDILGEHNMTTAPFGAVIDTGAGIRLPPNVGPSGIAAGYGESTSAGRSVAMLWRVLREPEGARTSTADEVDLNFDYKQQNSLNDPANDLLADRLRDPSTSGSSSASVVDELLSDIQSSRDMGGGIDGPAWTQGGSNRTNCASPIPAGTDNFGFVTVSFARFARPLDPALGPNTTNPGRGTLPAWCIESKLDRDLVTTAAWNNRQPGGSFAAWSLNWSDSRDDISANPTVGRAACTFFSSSSTVVIDPIADKPMHARLTSAPPAGIPSSAARHLGLSGRTGEPPREWLNVAPVYISRGLIGSDSGALQDRTVLNPGLYSRSADFLLPLAVGPEFIPGRAGSQFPFFSPGVDDRLRELESQWLTLAESLALGTGYYSPPAAPTAVNQSWSIYYNFSNDTRSTATAQPIVPKVERGALVIDAWAPHLSTLQNQYNPVGAGIPLALSIIDQFRVAPGISTTNAADRLSDSAFGSVSTLEPGRMNINTMSVANLRVLPLVSPEVWGDQNTATARGINAAWTSPGQNAPGAVIGRCCASVAWSGQGNPATVPICQIMTQAECSARAGTVFQAGGVCDPGEVCGSLPPNTDTQRPAFPQPAALTELAAPFARPTIHLNHFVWGAGGWNTSLIGLHYQQRPDYAWDIAPTIAAYRDRSVEATRGVNDASNLPTEGDFSSFLDTDQRSANGRFNALDTDAATSTNGLALGMGIAGMREARGFKSIGEVLMANQYHTYRRGNAEVRQPAGPSNNQAAPAFPSQSVQRFGNVERGHIPAGEVSGFLTRIRDNNTGRATNQLVEVRSSSTLANRIAVASAIAGTSGVRSDIFTIYFLVHGYLRQDVEGLEDDQPMVPSLSKRFVMVVDRSNVTRLGDKPKVLLLKEVPLE